MDGGAAHITALSADIGWYERLSPCASSARNADGETTSLIATARIVEVSCSNGSKPEPLGRNRFTKAVRRESRESSPTIALHRHYLHAHRCVDFFNILFFGVFDATPQFFCGCLQVKLLALAILPSV